MSCDSLSLTAAECGEYSRRIGLAAGRPSWDYLLQAVDRILQYSCYSNLGMLLRQPRHAPTRDEIVADMLDGINGTCTVANVFAHSFLAWLGFDCELLPCRDAIGDAPKLNHIGLRVRLDGGDYFTDFGNGYPYFTPCRFGSDEEHEYGGFVYRLVPHDRPGWYRLQHKSGRPHFADDLWIEHRPVARSHFAEMTEQHHTNRDFGRLLNCLRLIRFSGRRLYALRYDCEHGGQITCSDGGEIRRQPVKLQAVAEIARREFPRVAEGVQQALRILHEQREKRP